MILRIIKTGMVATIALFFTVIAWDNIIDFKSNFLFVQHVLSMDTTFHQPAMMERAITNANIQTSFYYFIIATEFLTALCCWMGVIVLILNINQTSQQFNRSKTLVNIGLFIGFALYMVGFIIIGGEWFAMWQSPTWNGQMKAGLFISLIMFVMIFLNLHELEK